MLHHLVTVRHRKKIILYFFWNDPLICSIPAYLCYVLQFFYIFVRHFSDFKIHRCTSLDANFLSIVTFYKGLKRHKIQSHIAEGEKRSLNTTINLIPSNKKMEVISTQNPVQLSAQ